MKAQTLLMKARKRRVTALSNLRGPQRTTKVHLLKNTFRGRRNDHQDHVVDRLFAYLEFIDAAA